MLYLNKEYKRRMNTPSVATGNWGWRISSKYATNKLINKVHMMTVESKRV